MYTVHIPYKYRQTANPLYGYVNPPMYHTISLLEAFLKAGRYGIRIGLLSVFILIS